ncbi:MAG: hypothetical protein ACREMZ_09675 [Gemmatimonadales bacterium]
MPSKPRPALTPEQWEARDYRQAAREIDAWAKTKTDRRPDDDATEYVAKIGLNQDGSVIVMNRAHDRVVVPPPARATLAALALLDQPFGITPTDISVVRGAADTASNQTIANALHDLASRLEALAPPSES